MKPIKIGVIGPESTGKSTLCSALQHTFGCIIVPEYARTYVEHLRRPYTYDDVCAIAEQNREECGVHRDACTIYDTELIVTKIWLDEVYGKRPEWIGSPIPEDCQMDFYLLMYPDIAWQTDPVRENGSDERRMYLFERYLHEVQQTSKPYHIIRGSGPKRTQDAIDAIKALQEIL